MSKRDYALAAFAGLLMGFLALPVLKALGPAVFAHFALATVPVVLLATLFLLTVAYAIGRKFSFLWQLGKFAVTGVLNMFVDWGVLTSLIFLFREHFRIDPKDLIIAGITFYSLYKAASFIVANINSYYWNKYWTFGVRALKKTKAEFFQFFTVSAIGFAANVFVASYVFKTIQPVRGFNTDQWGIIGAALGSAAGLFWNFLGYKFIVFKGR